MSTSRLSCITNPVRDGATLRRLAGLPGSGGASIITGATGSGSIFSNKRVSYENCVFIMLNYAPRVPHA